MASLKERIDLELKESMRAKSELTTSVLRMLKSAIKYKEVEPGGKPLDDQGVLQVIGTLIKQRRDSVEQFRAGGRPELAEKEEKEISLLQAYLPAQLTPAELDALISEAIAATGAASIKDMGKVMGLVKPKAQGRADMGALSARIKQKLG